MRIKENVGKHVVGYRNGGACNFYEGKKPPSIDVPGLRTCGKRRVVKLSRHFAALDSLARKSTAADPERGCVFVLVPKIVSPQ